jgi:hypothetical protein
MSNKRLGSRVGGFGSSSAEYDSHSATDRTVAVYNGDSGSSGNSASSGSGDDTKQLRVSARRQALVAAICVCLFVMSVFVLSLAPTHSLHPHHIDHDNQPAAVETDTVTSSESSLRTRPSNNNNNNIDRSGASSVSVPAAVPAHSVTGGPDAAGVTLFFSIPYHNPYYVYIQDVSIPFLQVTSAAAISSIRRKGWSPSCVVRPPR